MVNIDLDLNYEVPAASQMIILLFSSSDLLVFDNIRNIEKGENKSSSSFASVVKILLIPGFVHSPNVDLR
jgi:hypothetical protein